MIILVKGIFFASIRIVFYSAIQQKLTTIYSINPIGKRNSQWYNFNNQSYLINKSISINISIH